MRGIDSASRAIVITNNVMKINPASDLCNSPQRTAVVRRVFFPLAEPF